MHPGRRWRRSFSGQTARARLLLVDTDETVPQQPPQTRTLMAPGTGWWAKFGNAERNRKRLIQACMDFRDQRPFYVEAEPTGHPDRTAYRPHLTIPIPVEISLLAGTREEIQGRFDR